MKLRHSILGLLLCGSLVVSNLQAAPAQPKQELAAGSALLIDLKTGQELYSSNPDLRLPVASVTKLMTAMVVLDAKLPLLHLRPEHRSRWFDWEGLFRALGIASLPTPGALRFDNYTLLIQAAIAGQGVAIGWRHLVDELLAQGLLCRLGEAEAHSARGYYLVLPERKRRQRLTARFVDWLQAELDSPAASV